MYSIIDIDIFDQMLQCMYQYFTKVVLNFKEAL